MEKLYKRLMEKTYEIVTLGEVLGLIGWDFEVMMPPKGAGQRGKQMAYLQGLIHEKFTDPKIGQLLKEIKEHKEYDKLTDLQKRNIYLLQRDYDRQTKVPTDLVKEIAELQAKSAVIWKEAREKSDFALFKPSLEKIIELQEKRVKYIDPSKPPYEVMLDEYEPGFTSDLYTKLFNELKEGLIPLIKKCVSSSNQPDISLIRRHCPKSVQKELEEKEIIPILGYDLEAGRLDTTVHPFTSGSYDDVRITTRYDENNFAQSFFAVMHEAGHGIYNQNLFKECRQQPIAEPCSGGMHESQSRFFENIIGRSPEFWEFLLPKFKKITGSIFEDVEKDSFLHAINRVKQSPIRVEADEVTYGLHIILRFEIERDIFAGKVKVDDLPKLWNAKMKEYLDYDVKSDAEGVLQDTHWSWGLFGYFPNYALGNLYGAQLLNQLAKDIPDYRSQIRQGNVLKLKGWLVKHIHLLGSRYDPLDLIKHVTGEELNPQYFLNYLTEKYSKIYGF